MHVLKRICQTTGGLFKQACQLPHVVAVALKQRRRQIASEQAAGAIDDLGSVEGGKVGQCGTGEHVAAVGGLVGENAVIEEVNAYALAFADEGRFGHALPWQGLTGFREIDVPGQV